jgi:hypothetical protein
MNKILFALFITSLMIIPTSSNAGWKSKGEKCVNNAECGSQLECKNGVCVKKKEWDFGGSGKTGKPCNIDADCIGSGKCVEGSFGRKSCSGN